jgi:hypothetical protein
MIDENEDFGGFEEKIDPPAPPGAKAKEHWNGANAGADDPPPGDDPPPHDEPQAPPPLVFLRADHWDGCAVPEVRWQWHQRLVMKNVGALFADGGQGKTMVALQLCTSTVRGTTDCLGAVINESGPPCS